MYEADYDARTRRLAKREATDASGDLVATLYRYDGGTSYQELNADGDIKVEHARAGGMGGGVGSILYADRYSGGDGGQGGQPAGSLTTEHFSYNAVGHAAALTDDQAAVTSVTALDAFGLTAGTAGDGSNDRLAYTKQRDASLGLDLHGFRHYDPSTGRYHTRDPIGYADGPNVYLHVKNDPVNGFDPLGLYISKLVDAFHDNVSRPAVGFGARQVRKVSPTWGDRYEAVATASIAFQKEFANGLDIPRRVGNALATPVTTARGVAAGVQQKAGDTAAVYNRHGLGTAAGELTGISGIAEGVYNVDLVTGRPVGDGFDRFIRAGEGTAATLGTASAVGGGAVGTGRLLKATRSRQAAEAAEGVVKRTDEATSATRFWYHGTDPKSAAAIRTLGLDTGKIAEMDAPDVRGFFMTPSMDTAVNYGRSAAARRPGSAVSSDDFRVLRLDVNNLDTRGLFLQDFPRAIGGERMIRSHDFDKFFPRDFKDVTPSG